MFNIFGKKKQGENQATRKQEETPNWKKKINDLKESERIESELANKNAEKEKIETTKRENEAFVKRQQDEYNAKKLELGKKFQCHVCGIPAQKPTIRKEISGYESVGYGAPGSPIFCDETYWDLPSDLERCTICHEWTCEEDLYKGICQSCAEKL